MANEVQMTEGYDLTASVLDSPNLLREELAESKKNAANQCYSLKQYKEALKGYNEVIEMCPNMPLYYGNRAACYMMLGLYRNAVTDARKCIELDPKFLKAYVRVIKCSLILGNIIEAEINLSRLWELDPDNKAINEERRDLEYVQRHLQDADAAYAAKDFRKVVYSITRCCDVSKYCTRFKLTKAECLTFLGRYKESQLIANDVRIIDKENPDANYIIGMCLYFQDQVDKALAYFEDVLRLAPDHVKTLNIYKRAKALKKKKSEGTNAFRMKRYQQAYDLFTEALTIDPQNLATNAKLHFNKAQAAFKIGRISESITACTEALKFDENYVKALVRRGISYVKLEEFEKAVRDLEKAYKLDRCSEYRVFLNGAKMALGKSKRKDYYRILGIEENASTEDIRKAYKKRALVHHPDRHADATEGEKKEQEKKFKEVVEAYGILSDPKKRSHYDNSLEDTDFDSMPSPFFGPPGSHPYQYGFYSSFSFKFD